MGAVKFTSVVWLSCTLERYMNFKKHPTKNIRVIPKYESSSWNFDLEDNRQQTAASAPGILAADLVVSL